MTNWKISQKKGFLKIWSLVEVSQIDHSMIISMRLYCPFVPFSSGFSVRADELTNQTDNESTLLNLQFLQMELQTFMDGYKFKGFYFPIRSVVSTFINYFNSNSITVTSKEFKLISKSCLDGYLSKKYLTTKIL